jgi:hypothetical protein
MCVNVSVGWCVHYCVYVWGGGGEAGKQCRSPLERAARAAQACGALIQAAQKAAARGRCGAVLWCRRCAAAATSGSGPAAQPQRWAPLQRAAPMAALCCKCWGDQGRQRRCWCPPALSNRAHRLCACNRRRQQHQLRGSGALHALLLLLLPLPLWHGAGSASHRAAARQHDPVDAIELI